MLNPYKKQKELNLTLLNLTLLNLTMLNNVKFEKNKYILFFFFQLVCSIFFVDVKKTFHINYFSFSNLFVLSSL